VEQETLNALRDEIHAWHLRNYPKDDLYSALLGVQEEYGELCRAQLKQDGGIRGTWDEWQTEKFKEAGDVMIGLLNVAGFLHTMIRVFPEGEPDFVRKPDLKKLLLSAGVSLSFLFETADDNTFHDESFRGLVNEEALSQSFVEIAVYVHACKLDPIEALKSRWTTISKRDFIANPATGGRENEVG
jgi:hypothetical protein